MQSWETGSRWPWWSRRVGENSLWRSLSTSAILWLCKVINLSFITQIREGCFMGDNIICHYHKVQRTKLWDSPKSEQLPLTIFCTAVGWLTHLLHSNSCTDLFSILDFKWKIYISWDLKFPNKWSILCSGLKCTIFSSEYQRVFHIFLLSDFIHPAHSPFSLTLIYAVFIFSFLFPSVKC